MCFPPFSIGKLIQDFFVTIKHLIPHPSYVIDFYVARDESVKVIELNPFVRLLLS